MSEAMELQTQVQPSYLSGNELSHLTEQVESVRSKLEGAKRSTFEAMMQLEDIRWEGEWRKDPIWKQADEARANQDLGPAARSFPGYIRLQKLTTLEEDISNDQKYRCVLTMAVLTEAVNAANRDAGSLSLYYKDNDAAPRRLPTPENVSDMRFLTKSLEKEDRRPKDPAQQLELLDTWRQICERYPRYDGEEPLPPRQKDIQEYFDEMRRKEQLERLIQQEAEEVETVDATVIEREETEAERIAREAAEREAAERRAEERQRAEAAERELQERLRKQRQANDKPKMTETQRRLAEMQAKRDEEQREVREQVKEYSRRLNRMEESVLSLRDFVKSIDSTKGTQFIAEMREFSKADPLGVSDDVERVQRTGMMLGDIRNRIITATPPSGIDVSTIEV